MELRIEPYQMPEQILFNYEELKNALIEKAQHYETLIYTEDQIQTAKTDRANLNKLKKALNDERIKREKEYMKEFNVFKAQINELIGIVDKAIINGDSQIKSFEEQQKKEKLEKIQAYWDSFKPAFVPVEFKTIFDEKWLNASVKMSAVEKEIDSKIQKITEDIATIEKLPSYSFEAREIYINTIDLGKAISHANSLRETAEKKALWEAEQEKKRAEAKAAAKKHTAEKITDADTVDQVPQKQWIRFQAFLSIEEAKALKEFFVSRNIEYKSI